MITARLDLDALDEPGLLERTLATVVSAGSTDVIAVLYDGADPRLDPIAVPGESIDAAVDATRQALGRAPCRLVEMLLVRAGRWWSLSARHSSRSGGGQAAVGHVLPDAPSPYVAAAAYAGVVAHPDRAALEAVLTPLPAAQRERLEPALAAAENAAVQAALTGCAERARRAVERAVFAGARASDEPGWQPLGDADVARFGAALSEIALRDAVWLAVDERRLDGRRLWCDLARRLPSPYDAAPAFVFGWASWRRGEATLAAVAARRALDGDADCTAAQLLLAAIDAGIDPRRLPRMRGTRPS